jgi:hypothetical protein
MTKPTMNPVLVRSVLTLLGTALAAMGAASQLTWQTALAALGSALIGWMRTAPNHIDIDALPEEVRESVRPQK